MIEAADVTLEKGWMLKNKVGNIYTEHKTRKEARGVKKGFDAYNTSGDSLLLYKYFKVIDKESGAITIVMTKSS